MMRLLTALSCGAVMTLAACTAEKKASEVGDTAAVAAASDMGAMSSNSSMSMSHTDSVAQRATADLEQFASAPEDQLKDLLPAHTSAVEALLADCEQMMKQMKMTPPAKWNRATTEIRSDLKRMEGLSPSQLKAFVHEHRTHVEGILGMRHDMMKM